MPHRPAPHSGLRRSDGFSLVELMLTAVIVGVVAAIGVPRYADALARYQIDAAAQRVLADLEHAQTQARARSASVTVSLDLAHDRIEIAELTDLNGGASPYVTELSDEPYRADLTEADFNGDSTLVFDGYGRPDSGGGLSLSLGIHVRTISVDADTGKASLP